ncbi:hypothetical protein N7486_009151 [Penicillium sp. IBT 16267x]|nr:hypothetical protein N7486_009151 [Penicillium sp. IBT 16267x]
MTRTGDHIETDAIVIGGGFGGCNSLYKLRNLGLSVKLMEAGSAFGGFNIPAVYKCWNWSERFPGDDELRRYFKHVDSVLGLSQDTFFNTIITSVQYDATTSRWNVSTVAGLKASCKYLIAATGSSYRKHFPQFNGLEKYGGQLVHAADYPENLNVKGKSVGVVGNGASGLHIIQTLAKEDRELTAFIRTPCFAIPMKQRSILPDEAEMLKGHYDCLFDRCYNSLSGFPHNTRFQSAHQATPEERKELFDELWERGGYNFLVSNYYDFLLDEKTNAIFYDYWVQKTRARMTDRAKMDIVAPLKQHMLVGTKRPSLELDYYEMIDRPNVTLHDLKRSPIVDFDHTGMGTGNSEETQHHDLDVLILATGYDAVTGSLLDLAITDKNQVPLAEKWKDGVLTYLGLMIPDAPNLFMVYGPQAPTSLPNGPPFIEMEVDCICKTISKMQEKNLGSIEPTQKLSRRGESKLSLSAIIHCIPRQTLGTWGPISQGSDENRSSILVSCTSALESWEDFDAYA